MRDTKKQDATHHQRRAYHTLSDTLATIMPPTQLDLQIVCAQAEVQICTYGWSWKTNALGTEKVPDTLFAVTSGERAQGSH